ncbi:hypothetical protein C0Q70_14664 [Pomacea canaliculata]|uniref:15-oxoprostaglandin 13-reductase n=1 Tax=Pomacea canaliculata TaxID=400727 RepID=A0A2T7NSQ2_POMCA|nr:hypothetical protein C0Q70_14664 [Pomacea canaliculata]
MGLRCKKWTLARTFHGEPKLSDFQLVEEEISAELQPGEVLVEALYLTVDPYMRIKLSKNLDYPEGSLVLAYTGWRTHTVVSNPKKKAPFGTLIKPLPDLGDLPLSLALGCLGMPGLTAYFGVLDKGQVKCGETVLVNAAAGAVGSVAGQIVKIKGCKVIGSTGTDTKCDWLREIGFDHVFNYKTKRVDDALKEFAPQGVDVYFDNVGGDFSSDVMRNHMKAGGRVVEVGSISEYNDTESKERSISKFVADKHLSIRGMSVSRYVDRYPQALAELLKWIREGKLKYKETITEGFEHMPNAFISLFRGGNIGKAVVRV